MTNMTGHFSSTTEKANAQVKSLDGPERVWNCGGELADSVCSEEEAMRGLSASSSTLTVQSSKGTGSTTITSTQRPSSLFTTQSATQSVTTLSTAAFIAPTLIVTTTPSPSSQGPKKDFEVALYIAIAFLVLFCVIALILGYQYFKLHKSVHQSSNFPAQPQQSQPMFELPASASEDSAPVLASIEVSPPEVPSRVPQRRGLAEHAEMHMDGAIGLGRERGRRTLDETELATFKGALAPEKRAVSLIEELEERQRQRARPATGDWVYR